jgi:hypothetical protein
MNWAWLAGWPAPFALLAGSAVVFRLRDTASWGWLERAEIVTINYALVYAAALLVVRLIVGEFAPKTVLIPSCIAGLVTASLLIPAGKRTGPIQLGVGDLLHLPGIAVVGFIEDLTRGRHRSALQGLQSVEAALRGQGTNRFRVAAGAVSPDGWTLSGFVQHGGGLWAPALVHVDPQFKVDLALPPEDTFEVATAFDQGELVRLNRRSLLRWKDHQKLERTELSSAAVDWLAGQSVIAHRSTGRWLLSIDLGGPEILSITDDGRAVGPVRLAEKGEIGGLSGRGDTIYAVVVEWEEEGGHPHGRVVQSGEVDEQASEAFDQRLRELALQSPYQIAAGENVVWVVASFDGEPVALSYPGEGVVRLDGRFVYAIDTAGDDLVVAMGRKVLRVGRDGAQTVVATVRVERGLFGVLDGGVYAGVLEDGQIAASMLDGGEQRRFLPNLVLHPSGQ